MADRRHLFVRQRSLLIGVVTAVVCIMASCSLPLSHSVNQGIVIPATLVGRQLQPNLNNSKVKTLIAQRDEAYSKVITRLAKEDQARRLNFSVPVQFQGKTIRDVQLNSEDKAHLLQRHSGKTQGVPTKPKDATASRYPIALTFDDGPWPTTTSQVLDVLKKNNVKATFFMVGKQVEKYPQLLKQVVAEGHAIGNHTWSHQYGQYDESAAAHELNDAAALFDKTTGVKTSLFRPPAGILNNGLAAYAQQKKYAVVVWSVDSKDWRYHGTTTKALLESVVKDAKPGGIVLLHDGGGDRSTTVQALPQLITALQKRGYTFVTVPELLEMADKK